MTEARVERRLAAILAADVAGYSRLMGADEVGTLAALKALRREIVDPTISEHNGRIVKTTGDGMLVEFGSAVDAVTCAMIVQSKMADPNGSAAQKITFRIGVNVGDIIIDGDDIFGDGVNVAARVENECEPGGVFLSDDAYRQVRGKIAFGFDDLGEKSLKNIDRPVRIYAVRSLTVSEKIPATSGSSSRKALSPPQAAAGAFRTAAGEAAEPLPLPDRPSIAVLPFTNMSGDPEQEYFADGVVEDIITALSRFKSLFVIARNSSFTYKGKAVDIKQVGRELGVRYVLEGSLRKAGGRVRITGQLIEASTDRHLWADKFDGSLDDIFELQDNVTEHVVSAIAPKLEQAEIDRAKHKPTESLDAYDCFLRGMANVYRSTRECSEEALTFFHKAAERDSEFASAYAMAAWCYHWRRVNLWAVDRGREAREAVELARRARQLGKDDPIALCRAGLVLIYFRCDLESGVAMTDRALLLNPNLAPAWFSSGWVRLYLGEPEVAIEHMKRAIRLSPLDPLLLAMYNAIATAHLFAGRYDEASSWAEKALREKPDFVTATRSLAASSALAGRFEQAQTAIARLCQLDPALRISNLGERLAPYTPRDFETYAEGLRRAGLPE